MKKLVKISIMVGILSLYFISVFAFDVYFDINMYCRRVANSVGGSYQIEQICREEELKAKRALERMFIPERIKRYCSRVAKAVGGSYQIMKTCVEQELEAKKQLGY